jgi:hypothetical protein
MSSSAGRRDQKKLERQQRLAAQESVVLEFAYPPAALLVQGPVIVTDVGLTETHAEALRSNGQDVPAPIRCRFLIDTGAGGCVVKHDIAERAGLKLVNSNVPIHGVGIDTTGRIYMGRIMFATPSRSFRGVTQHISIETEIHSGTLQNSQVIDGLIGRRVLERFELKYNGANGKFSLRFIRPT